MNQSTTQAPGAPVKVAALQMVSGPDVAANLAAAERLIGEAASLGARIALLPEYFCIMGNRDTDKVDAREAPGGPIQSFIAGSAARHRIAIVGGTVPLVAPKAGRVINTCQVYDAQGRHLARYDKIHLFGFHRGGERFDESATIVRGRTPVVCDIPIDGERLLRTGLSICYDLRFPELYRRLAPCDLLVVPSAFTYTTGAAHWELLLRARAIENQCYVLAATQGGRHPSGRRTWGHSMLVDPWGDVVAVLPEGEGVVCAEIDFGRIAEIRTALPALRHRVL